MPYGAGLLALAGRAADAYAPEALARVQGDVAGGPVAGLPFPYPPIALFPAAALALIDWPVAIVAWSILGIAALFAAGRLLAPSPVALAAALLLPAAAHALMAGQNGALIAALIGGGLLLLDRRPLLAGLLIGLAAFKPQLGLLLPVALLAGGHRQAFAAAAATVAVTALAALAVFGPASWSGFLAALADAGGHAASGAAPPEKMVSVLSAARLAGLGAGAAWGLQGLAALAALFATVRLWRGPRALADKAALTLLLAPLATPYAFYTDMAILLFPVLRLWQMRDESAVALPLAAALWLGSGLLFALGLLAGWQLWPPALLAALLAWPGLFPPAPGAGTAVADKRA